MDALSLQGFLHDFEPHSHDESAAGGLGRSHVPFPTCVFHWIYIGMIIIIDNTCSNNPFFNSLTILYMLFHTFYIYACSNNFILQLQFLWQHCLHPGQPQISFDYWVSNMQLIGIDCCTIYWYTNTSFSLFRMCLSVMCLRCRL